MFERSLAVSRRGSQSRLLFDGLEAPQPGSAKAAFKGALLGGHPSYPRLLRAYGADYLTILLLICVLVWSETAEPFHKVFYTKTDQEYWRYSYPLHVHNTVPAWSVPLIATCVPAAAICAVSLLRRPSRLELHNAVLGLLFSVFLTATVTNLIKLGVGRPRPNFAARCWPHGQLRFTPAGVPDCAPDSVNPEEGRKSFPSGHTSWSTSGLAYLTFWLAGCLGAFDGSGHPARLVLAGTPLGCAAWIGITRLQDYWHHWEDVLAGFLLGLTFAYLCYRQHYHPLLGARSGEAYAAAAVPAAEERESFPDLEAGGQDM